MIIKGSLVFPGDKSISHRALIFGTMTNGRSTIKNISNGADVASTIQCLRLCNIKIDIKQNELVIYGSKLKDPKEKLDCGNSGTTARLLIGFLSGQGINATFIGDNSLSARPMDRILDPLKSMGLKYDSNNKYLPITIEKSALSNKKHFLKIASAQIKSAIILASLYSKKISKIKEINKSRDHTEIILKYLGANITSDKDIVLSDRSTNIFRNFEITVPGDPSSAAFFAAATLSLPGSKLNIKSILLNPTRIGFFNILISMGADIKFIYSSNTLGEKVGDIIITHSKLKSIKLTKKQIPSMIDELPIFAVLATQATGTTVINNAEELRYKECDRIHAICYNLKNMGADITEKNDGFIINGPANLKGSKIKTFHDHRIAMAFTIASLFSEGNNILDNSDCVSISYPDFFKTLEKIKS